MADVIQPYAWREGDLPRTTWERLNQFVRSVADRLNQLAPPRSVHGVSGSQSAQRSDIAGTANQVLRVNAAGDALAFGTVTVRSLDAVPAASIARTTAQSISTGGSPTVLDFTSTDYVLGGADAPVVDLTANTITIRKAGLYRMSGRAGWIPSGVVAAGAILSVQVEINSTPVAQAAIGAVQNVPTMVYVAHSQRLAVGDVVRLTVFQNSGNSQSTVTGGGATPVLQVEYVGAA